MKVKHTDEEPIYSAEYEPEALEHIIDTQHKNHYIHEKTTRS